MSLKMIISEEFLMLTNEASFSVHIPAISGCFPEEAQALQCHCPSGRWSQTLLTVLVSRLGPGCAGMWCSGEVEDAQSFTGCLCRAGLWPQAPLVAAWLCWARSATSAGQNCGRGVSSERLKPAGLTQSYSTTELFGLWEALLL